MPPDDLDAGFRAEVLAPLRRSALALLGFLVLFGAWATLAELATTVRVSGHLSAPRPSHALQHPMGGRIADVDIALRQRVAGGDVLFRFDVAAEQKTLTQIEHRIQLMEVENRLVGEELNQITPSPSPRSQALDEVIARRFVRERRVLALAIDRETGVIQSAQDLRAALTAEIALLEARRALVADRSRGLTDLAARGVVREIESDRARDQVMALESAILEKRSEVREVEERIDRARLDIASMGVKRHADLTALHNANLARLAELRAQASQLRAVTENAVVRAPADGMITQLNFNTPGMVARAGDTLAMLAAPLDAPRVEVRVPLTHIDQIAVGMAGKMTLSALAQREAPEIPVTITAVAREATRDARGEPAYYSAEAQVADEDLAAARADMGEGFRIAADMPVALVLEGRTTTLFAFLAQPFLSILDDAFEAT